MKRRILALLSALTLVLSWIPAAVSAVEAVTASDKAGTHTAAAHKCEECGTTEWLPWDSATTLPKSGHYYLTKDVTMTAPINDFAGTVHICLNGFVVKAASGKHHFNTRGVAEVVITDCTAYYDENEVYHAGAFTGGQDAVNGGGVAFIRRGGVVKVYDGRFTGNQAKAAGGAFCLQAADSSLAGGKLYMFDGEISNNQAISGTAYKAGGGVWLNSGCLFEMTGGAIRDNKANSGGAVYGVGTPTINISNAKLTGNHTTTSGAAIHDDSGSKVTITDSEITGNTCTNGTYGGAVFMGGSSGKLTLSGKVIIGDNSLAGTGIADINMNKAASDTLYIKDLAAGSDVTFSTPATAAADPDEVMSAVSQTGWSIAWVKYKTASGTEKYVDRVNGDFSFSDGHFHAGVEYLPLTSADQLIAGGNYYLAGDVSLDKEANLNPGVTLNLCLNGHKLTSTSGTSGICTRLNAAEATTINVYDCTAHTDASGNYVAGQITGMHNKSTGNGGGAFMIRPKGVLNFYAGMISDCSATVGGGAIFINGEAHIYGGEFRNNQAVSGTAAKNGGAIFLNDQGILTVENAKFVNNTTPKGAGGAIYATGLLTIKNTEFTGNSAPASSGGAIAYTGKKTINLEGCSFTGNQARSVSAINLGTSGLTAILKDVTVTGNTNTQGYGAVNAVGGVASLKLEGKVVIRDNKGDGKNDMHLQKGAVVMDVSALADGSQINVNLESARIDAGQLVFSTASDSNQTKYFASGESKLEVELNAGKQLQLTEVIEHIHCVCGKADCTDSTHEKVAYRAWKDAASMPKSGNYFLDVDVVAAEQTTLQNGKLNLCLHGHTVTVAKTASRHRVFFVSSDTTLNITDCTGNGKLTGTTAGTILSNASGKNMIVNLYGGSITDNHATATGCGVVVQGQCQFHMYGGSITNNTAENGAGVTVYSKDSRFYMHGGTIAGNKAANKGGGLYVYDGAVVVTGGVFANNEGKQGGAIQLNEQLSLTIENAKFENNTSQSSGGAIYAIGTLSVKNTAFTGNTAPTGTGGAVCYTGKGTITLENCTFTGNQARSASAVNLGTSGLSAVLKDITVTGNSNTNGFGAVNAVGGVASLKLEGKVVICENSGNGGSNLHLQKGTVVVDASALADGSKITIDLQDTRIGENQMVFSTASDSNKTGFFTCGDADYVVDLDQNKQLYLKPSVVHIHCLCGKTDCTDTTHEKVSYKAWRDSASMPKNGNYFLLTDVVAADQTTAENSNLNLCLHGHTVTVAETANRHRVYFVGSNTTMNIADCAGNGKITGTTAGAILTNGSGKNVTVNLYGGTFTENHATGTGATFVMQGQSTLNMYGGVITGNTAKSGGGVTVYGKNAKFFMYGGTIEGNQATAQGGGLYVSEGTAQLHAGVITGNKAQHGGGFYVTGNAACVNVQGAEVTGNTASSGGGGIAESGAVVNLSAGKISENKVTGSGAGLYISTDCTVNMTGGAMEKNKAANTGGAVYHLGSTGNYSGGSISGNTAKNGGALSGSLRVRNNVNIPTMVTISGEALFNGNTATSNAGTIYLTGEGSTVKVRGGTISGGKAKNAGGILAETKAVIEISGGKFTGNYAESNGGAVYASTNTKLTMTGGSISGNTAKAGASGIMLLRCTANFKGGSVTGNTAGAGGGVKISGANVTISSLTVSGNRAIGTLDAKTGKYTGGNAGGIEIGRAGYKQNNVQQWQYPSVYIYNIYLANNVSNAAAGGMLVQSDGTVFRMSGGTVTGNKSGATGGGGGIYFSTNSRPVVTGGTFVGNTSSNGGAIYVLNTTAEISNIVIKQNHSTGTGGGLTVTGKTTVVNVKDVEVFENTADNNAGGMLALNYAHLNLENVKIHDNVSAKRGGGLYYSQPGNGNLKDVEIYNNKANEGGGMVVDIHSHVTAQNLTVRDNTSESVAGGIYTRGRLEIDGGKVLNNTAKDSGGGIYSFKTNSSVLTNKTGMFITDTIVSGNTSGGQGGGIFAHAGCPTYLTNCTITENTASLEGGGLYAGGRMGMDSVTVTGNTSGGEGYAVYLPAALYDGHSNYTGFKAMGGDMIVKDNEGGDLYLGEETVLVVAGESLGEKSYVDLTFHSGVLSQWVHGVYNYEGSEQHYILTAGNRSLTEPIPYGEESSTQVQTKPALTNDILLYAGIGVVALAAAAGVILMLLKKKKSPAGETK